MKKQRTLMFYHIISILFLWGDYNLACTAFCLAEKDKYVFVGKNLDWPIGEGVIIINPRGISRTGQCNSNTKPVKWVSKCGSVTFNMFGEGFPLGGMNEKGLVVEELSYSPSIYPQNDSSYYLNELQWIQYQLDNFTLVDEVIENLGNIQISKLLFGIHYFISDSSGNSAVIEFINGKSLVYSKEILPFPLVVNNAYANSLKYLYKHKGFGGSLLIRNGPESPERFVRTAKLLQDCNTPNTNYAFKILNNVMQDDTQWSIVYDVLNSKILFFTKNNPRKKSISLKEINFSTTQTLMYFLIKENQNEENILNDFSLYTKEQNKDLLKQVFKKMVKLNEIDYESAVEVQNKIMNIN